MMIPIRHVLHGGGSELSGHADVRSKVKYIDAYYKGRHYPILFVEFRRLDVEKFKQQNMFTDEQMMPLYDEVGYVDYVYFVKIVTRRLSKPGPYGDSMCIEYMTDKETGNRLYRDIMRNASFNFEDYDIGG